MRHVSKAPSTVTVAEVKALLDATSRSEDDLRDHMALAAALGTGLRVSELMSRNVGDVQNGKGAKGVSTHWVENTTGRSRTDSVTARPRFAKSSACASP